MGFLRTKWFFLGALGLVGVMVVLAYTFSFGSAGGPSAPRESLPGSPAEAAPESESRSSGGATIRKPVAEHEIPLPESAAEGLSVQPESASLQQEAEASNYIVPVPSEQWEELYAGVSSQQLIDEADSILQYIYDSTDQEMKRRFRVGEYEITSQTGAVPRNPQFIKGLDRTRVLHGGEVRTVKLPEEEYAELYALGRQALWLRRQASLRKRRGHETFYDPESSGAGVEIRDLDRR